MKDPAHLLPTNPDQTVILVVDDEVMIVNIARIALEGDGHFVLTAENGEDGRWNYLGNSPVQFTCLSLMCKCRRWTG